MYHVSKYQEFQNLKSRYVLAIKYISKFKETLKLLLNIRIILSSKKIQLLQNQQFVNYFVKKLREITESKFLYFTSSRKIYVKYVLLSSQSNFSYLYVLMIKYLLKILLKKNQIFQFILCYSHCVKCVQMRSFFWSVFGHFSRSVSVHQSRIPANYQFLNIKLNIV